ncbi:hypothetical protein KIPB_012250, partial [Kipferlia bialata]
AEAAVRTGVNSCAEIFHSVNSTEALAGIVDREGQERERVGRAMVERECRQREGEKELRWERERKELTRKLAAAHADISRLQQTSDNSSSSLQKLRRAKERESARASQAEKRTREMEETEQDALAECHKQYRGQLNSLQARLLQTERERDSAQQTAREEDSRRKEVASAPIQRLKRQIEREREKVNAAEIRIESVERESAVAMGALHGKYRDQLAVLRDRIGTLEMERTEAVASARDEGEQIRRRLGDRVRQSEENEALLRHRVTELELEIGQSQRGESEELLAMRHRLGELEARQSVSDAVLLQRAEAARREAEEALVQAREGFVVQMVRKGREIKEFREELDGMMASLGDILGRE